jgi:hypothetical protein
MHHQVDNTAMMENFLRQQSSINESGSECHDLVVAATAPPSNSSLGGGGGHNMSLEDFKEYVRKYMEIDNWLKKAQTVIKEKKKIKDKLSLIITKFMIDNDIEDLNSRFGKISCRVKQTKQPITTKNIKEKLTDYFKHDETKCKQLIQRVFEDDRPIIEKVSLRRLRIT